MLMTQSRYGFVPSAWRQNTESGYDRLGHMDNWSAGKVPVPWMREPAGLLPGVFGFGFGGEPGWYAAAVLLPGLHFAA